MQILNHLAEQYRQWRHPRAFRIPALAPGLPQHDLEAASRALQESIQTLSDPAFLERAQNLTAADDQGFITDLLTRLWRLRKNLLQSGGHEPMPKAQRAHDQLERLFSKFEAMDLRIEDREGDLYDAGMAMKVISSEPMEGIGREVIKETYKPGIYRGSQLIQTPEVIIGLPIIETEVTEEASPPVETEIGPETEPEVEDKPETAAESNLPTAPEAPQAAPTQSTKKKKSDNTSNDKS